MKYNISQSTFETLKKHESEIRSNKLSAFFDDLSRDEIMLFREIIVEGLHQDIFSLLDDKTVPEYLFYTDGNIKSINIPEGFTVINNGAFAETQIESINIPESIKTIGTNAFYHTQLKELYIPENIQRLGINIIDPNKDDVVIKSKLSIVELTNRTFGGKSKFKSYLEANHYQQLT